MHVARLDRGEMYLYRDPCGIAGSLLQVVSIRPLRPRIKTMLQGQGIKMQIVAKNIKRIGTILPYRLYNPDLSHHLTLHPLAIAMSSSCACNQVSTTTFIHQYLRTSLT